MTEASYLIKGGSIYTMDSAQPWAQAVVVKGNKIAYVGTERSATPHVDPDTRVIDLAGGMCLPGFIDTHIHFVTGPLTKVGFSLAGVRGREAVQDVIRTWMAEHPDSPSVRGHGWMPDSFDNVSPKREWLDEITGGKPALVFSADIHDVWFNTALLEAAELVDAPDPIPGASYYWRDEDGAIEGRASEAPAILPLAVAIGAFSREGIMASLELGLMKAPSYGITSYMDAAIAMGADPKSAATAYELFVELDAAGQMPCRLVGTHVSFNPNDDHSDTVATLAEWNTTFHTDHVQVSMCKILADGVLMSGGGLLLEPFSHRHDHPEEPCGHMTWTKPAMVELIEKVEDAGFDMHIHTDADGTVRAVLDSIEEVRSKRADTTRRHTIAHNSVVHPDDVGRYKDMGLIANCTTIWGTNYNGQYAEIYNRILGPERVEAELFPYGDLVRSGATVTIGSDMPACELEEVPPLMQLEAAITRKRPGFPDDVPLRPKGAMSLADALRAYTINGAFALRLDDKVGSIEVGKDADLVVLGEDLFAVEPEKIHEVPVLLTMMDGTITFEAPRG